MWKKYQSRFDPSYVVQMQRAKEVFQTSVGHNQLDVMGEDNVVYRAYVNRDVMYKGVTNTKCWLMREGNNSKSVLWSDEHVTDNWQVYLEPLPTGTATPVPLSASKAWREYYHKSNPKRRVVLQDIYKISLVGESNTYRVEGVDGVIYNVPSTFSEEDYSLSNCKLVKTVHPNGNVYYSLMPGSSFAAFYHPVDGDPQPVEPEVAHVKPSEPDPADALYPTEMPPIRDGDMQHFNLVDQTQQFVTIFSAALSAYISSDRSAPMSHIVDDAYALAKLATEKLCGPQ